MAIEEIRKGAPLGATGYSIEKRLNGKFVYHKGMHYMWLNRWRNWIAWDNHNYEIKPL